VALGISKHCAVHTIQYSHLKYVNTTTMAPTNQLMCVRVRAATEGMCLGFNTASKTAAAGRGGVAVRVKGVQVLGKEEPIKAQEQRKPELGIGEAAVPYGSHRIRRHPRPVLPRLTLVQKQAQVLTLSGVVDLVLVNSTHLCPQLRQ
jgi:hypothetical protein